MPGISSIRAGVVACRAVATAGVSLTLVLLAGCGGGDSGGDGSPAADLAAYLPAESFAIGVIDLDGAREDLDLPADADAFSVDPSNGGSDTKFGDPEFDLASIAARGVAPYLQTLELFDSNPVAEALDGTKISAAASNEGGPVDVVSVIRTSQSFDQIADSLENAGFERSGGSLTQSVTGQSEPLLVTSVADGGDGVVVMAGGDADAADLVANPPGGPQDLVDLIASADEPIAVAGSTGTDSCLRAFGGWNDTGGAGVLRFEVDGGASADSVDTDLLKGTPLDAASPEVDGDTVEIPFAAASDAPPASASPVDLLLQQGSAFLIYDCGESSSSAGD